MTETTPCMDVRDEILKHLEDEGRKLKWLAQKIDVNYYTLYSTLKQKTIKLSDENKAKINKVLGTNF
jgi:lambda repressor-like predicted transcriptional regulator